MHQSVAASPLERNRHADFIARRLYIAFLALGVAPIYIAVNGAPSALETIVFAFSFTPLAAALVAARTGRIGLAHGIACAGLIGLSVSLYRTGCGVGVLATWLSAALLEASVSGSRRLAWGAAAVCLTAALGAAAATVCVTHAEPKAMAPATAALLAVLALVYAIVIAAPSKSAIEPRAARSEPDRHQLERAAIRLVDEMVVGFDSTGSVVRICSGETNRLEIATPLLMGRGLFEHVHVADRPGFLKLIADAARDDPTTMTRLRLRVPADPSEPPSRPRHVWIEMRATQLATKADDAPCSCTVVAVLRDVEIARAQEAEVVAAQTTMCEATRSKDTFLASMSHELRTPLNAIIGFSEMLASYTLRPSDVAKQREYARIIHQSGVHLLSVVNEILDMSKIRSGTFEIVPESFDTVPLLDLACDIVALKAQEGRVELVRDYPRELEAIVGDKRACKQIIINLLSNAVKFTPRLGTVTLSAHPEGTSLAITVTDTGIGIAATDLARLGDPFFQAHASLDRPLEGTGLGLSIVRGLVGLHGGTITIESEPSRGTRVRVNLPLDCRVRGQIGHAAEIETLALHSSFDADIGRIDMGRIDMSRTDRRMKKIA